MTPNVTMAVYEKASTNSEVESWNRVGTIRAKIRTLTAGQSLNESAARLDDRRITHDVICRWDDTLIVAGRIVVREPGHHQYRIMHAVEYGEALRDARARYMRVLLSEERYTVVPQ